MAEADKTKTPAPVETAISVGRTTTFDGETSLTREAADGVTEVDLSEIDLDDQEGSDTIEGGGAEGEDTATGAEGDDTTEGGEADDSDLGEYDPENEEVRAKFDAKYTDPETGELNKDVIGSEFWDNLAKAQAEGAEVKDHGYLNPATYAYLKDTYKLSDAFITEVEQGLVARNLAERQSFYSKVGGEARFSAAAAWARGGGYTPEQVARFNELSKKGGADFDDAVEALMNRAFKAGALKGVPGGQNGGGAKQDSRPGRRPSTPQRDATRGAAAAGTTAEARDVFKSTAEYQQAFNEVNKMPYRTPAEKKDKDAAFQALRAKGKRSRL